MSVANLKTKIMITAEEFFGNKIKEQNPNREVVTLSQELITAEQGLRWAHEFKQLHLHDVVGQSEQFEIIADRLLRELGAELSRMTKGELIKIISNSH